jgi:hypothetical protein
MFRHPGIIQVCNPCASNAESAPSPQTRAKNKMSSHSTKEQRTWKFKNRAFKTITNAHAFLRANDVRSVQNEIGNFRAIDVRGGRLKINQKAICDVRDFPPANYVQGIPDHVENYVI